MLKGSKTNFHVDDNTVKCYIENVTQQALEAEKRVAKYKKTADSYTLLLQKFTAKTDKEKLVVERMKGVIALVDAAEAEIREARELEVVYNSFYKTTSPATTPPASPRASCSSDSSYSEASDSPTNSSRGSFDGEDTLGSDDEERDARLTQRIVLA